MISSSKQFSSTEEHTDCKDTNCNKKAKPLPISASLALLPLISAFGIPAEFILPVSPLPVTGKAININNKPQKHSIMKTSNYLIAFAAFTSFTLVGCSDNDFLGNSSGPDVAQQGNGEITFSTGNVKMTRAGEITGLDAANRLNRQFIVWGDKHSTGEAVTNSDDVSVFTNYVVKYLDNSANTTESNTHSWEYVGYTPYLASQVSPAVTEGVVQSIKYWDYDAAGGYTFHGVSALPSDIEAGNVKVNKTQSASSVYDKGWTITVNDKASLADLYAADRKPVAKVDGSAGATDADRVNKYGGYVKLTFRSLVSKVRFAMYETVPGYSVNIDRFYVEAPAKDGAKAWDAIGSKTNFQIATEKIYAPVKSTGSTLTLTYDPTTGPNLNRVKVENQTTPASGDNYAVFGTNLNSADRIGETSPTATYDYADKAYTYVLPQEVGDMTLYVTYTLTSLDGSGDKIIVKGATAKVPASYNMWKNNFAYTYIFKISDNTNGSSGTIGDDPAGLYPITFDACVADESSDFQETITTVDEPSITTYANGKIVTENDEYKKDEPVYITVADDANYAVTIDNGASGNSRLFEVLNLGTENITEETVANYANNYMILKEVTASTTVVTGVPMSDTNVKTISALKFTPTAKVYAYQYKKGTKLYWKIIKIADGNATSIAATPSAGAAAITTYTGATSTTTTTLTDIIGAAPKLTATKAGATDNLKFTDNSNGTYTIAVKDKAIADGTANGIYELKYNGKPETSPNTVTVNMTYAYSPAAPAVAQGGSVTVALTAGGSPVPLGAKIETVDGITIKENSAGNYTITASSTVVGDKTVSIAGQPLTVKVTNYIFDATSYTYTVDKSSAAAISESAKNITLKANSTTAGAVTATDIDAVTTSAGLTLDGDDGVFIPSSTAGGVYNISYQGASATVTINEYDLNVASGNSATFNHETGSTKLTLKLNGKEIIPDKDNFTIVDGASDVTANFTISIVGKNITIAPKSGQVVAKTYTAKYTVNNAADTPALTVVAKIALTAQ